MTSVPDKARNAWAEYAATRNAPTVSLTVLEILQRRLSELVPGLLDVIAERDAEITAEWSHVDAEVWDKYLSDNDFHDDCTDICPDEG